jgi:hypothetical protein
MQKTTHNIALCKQGWTLKLQLFVRSTLVRADKFQFGFLLLTSTLYFQLGSSSGLDIIKYPTCSNTWQLAKIIK